MGKDQRGGFSSSAASSFSPFFPSFMETRLSPAQAIWWCCYASLKELLHAEKQGTAATIISTNLIKKKCHMCIQCKILISLFYHLHFCNFICTFLMGFFFKFIFIFHNPTNQTNLKISMIKKQHLFVLYIFI